MAAIKRRFTKEETMKQTVKHVWVWLPTPTKAEVSFELPDKPHRLVTLCSALRTEDAANSAAVQNALRAFPITGDLAHQWAQRVAPTADLVLIEYKIDMGRRIVSYENVFKASIPAGHMEVDADQWRFGAPPVKMTWEDFSVVFTYQEVRGALDLSPLNLTVSDGIMTVRDWRPIRRELRSNLYNLHFRRFVTAEWLR